MYLNIYIIHDLTASKLIVYNTNITKNESKYASINIGINSILNINIDSIKNNCKYK